MSTRADDEVLFFFFPFSLFQGYACLATILCCIGGVVPSMAETGEWTDIYIVDKGKVSISNCANLHSEEEVEQKLKLFDP